MGISRCSIIGVLLVLLIPLSGCESISVGKRLKRMSDHPVVFPSSLKRIDGVNNLHQNLDSQLTRLVIYVDSSICSSCRLNDLGKYSELYGIVKQSSDFHVVIIIWPNQESSANIENNIKHRSLPFDVFLDREGQFLRENPSIPKKDYRFHTFLLNRENRPVMVGDPMASDRLMELFRKSIDLVGVESSKRDYPR